MARLLFANWRLMRPGIDPLELPAGFAVAAVNCDLRQKTLAPLAGLGSGQQLPQPGALRSFYNLAGNWLAWTSSVEVVELPVPATRIAYSGDGYPKLTTPELATSGGEPATYPAEVRRYGVKRPTAPLIVTVNNPVGSGTVLREVSYVYTLVVVWGEDDEEESKPSDPTVEFTVYEGESLTLDSFVWDPLAGNDISLIRIYRLEVGSTDAEYQFLAEIPVSQPEYLDDCLEDAGPDLLESEEWDCPPDDLAGLFLFGNNVMCGFSGRNLYFSPPDVYYAMPKAWSLQAQEDIVAAGWFGRTVVFVTAARQYRATGTDPQYMDQETDGYSRGCVSRASLVSCETGVFYAAADCLVLATAAGNQEPSLSIYTAEQWQALGPENLHGFFIDGIYYGFFAGTSDGIAVDPENLDVQEISLGGALFWAGRYDRESRTLQLLLEDGGAFAVHAWRADQDTPLACQYTSAPQLYPADTACSCGKVLGDFSAGQVGLEVLVDGEVVDTLSVSDASQFRLQPGCVGSQWQIRRTGGAGRLDAVMLAGHPAELRHGQ